jgi:hypothetical protein
MGIDMDNVIEFPARAGEPTVLEFEIGIGGVDEARRSLECLEATVSVGLNLCGKAETAGDALVLAGLHRLFAAFNALLLRDRGIEPFNPDPCAA